MFSFDTFNRPEPVSIFLCRPDDSVVCELNGIDESTAQLKLTLNNQAELTFDYNRYITDLNGNLVESNGYHSLNVDMQLLISSIGFFRMKYPPMTWDGDTETKTITAYSCECELEDKDLVGFKINTGENDSLEYLITYDDDETEELLSAYTGLPYDYITFNNTYPEQLEELLNKYADDTTLTDEESVTEIVNYCSTVPRLKRRTYTETYTDEYGNEQTSTSLTEYVEYTYDAAGENVISVYLFDGFNARISELITFYTKYHNQLSLIPLAIENCLCNWSVGSIDSSLSNKKYKFDVDGENIYSFLTNTVAETCECVFVFDLFNRAINVMLVENIGVDSGVIMDKSNLMNNLEVSCETDSIYTRYSVSGGNDIDIKYVNFGSKRIDDITFFIYARDEDGNRIYMSDTLAEKYLQFIADRDAARNYYITYTKTYNQLLSDIDELKYRVPDDALEEDYDDYTQEELDGLLTVYNNLLVTLKTLYKEQYGSAGCNSDGSINESYMKGTEYWYDYYAYVHTIEMIEVAIYAQGYYTTSDDEDVIAYYESIGYDITGWETEWSLYGTVELQAKIDAYTNSMQVLSDAQSVLLDDNGAAIPWNSLTATQKAEYGGTTSTTTETEDYITLEIDYKYNEYMELYNLRVSAQEYLDGLLEELADMEEEQATAQANRQALLPLITLAGYDRAELGELVDLEDSDVSGTFTAAEIQTITRLYIDKNYSNEYILTTSLDTTVTTVDVEYELLEDAEEELSKDAQPQISFNAEIDNLMAIPEFKDFDFSIGNYVTVKYYDDYYVTLRLYSMTYNPLIPEESLDVTFTNFIKSKSKRSDMSYILDQVAGSSSSGSSSSSSGSGSTFGDSDDIDVTISNTMLAKLLNTEMFGTRVTDVILDSALITSMTARYATFGGLAKGTTVIDGQCISTGYILSTYYNGTKNTTHLDEDGNETSETTVSYELNGTVGSIFVLKTGEFNFGGGAMVCKKDELDNYTITFSSNVKLTWNNVTTDDGSTLESYINDAVAGASSDIDTSKYLTLDAAGELILMGGTEITNYYLHSANLVGGQIMIGAATYDGSVDIPFIVYSDGSVYASSCDLTGKITATSGYIGGWSITQNGLVYDDGKTNSGNNVYVMPGVKPNSDSSAGNFLVVYDKKYGTWPFYVNVDGFLHATNAEIYGDIYADNGYIGDWEIYESSLVNRGYGTYMITIAAGISGSDDFLVVTKNPSSSSPTTTFYVHANGDLYAANATIYGVLNASAGSKIGGFTISSNSLYTNYNHTSTSALGTYSDNIYLGYYGLSISTKFKVTNAGALTCTSGSIAGWTLADGYMYVGSTTSMTSTSTGIYLGANGMNCSGGFKVYTDGTMEATAGTIGSWSISEGGLVYGLNDSTKTYTVYVLPGSNSNGDFLVVKKNSDSTYPFSVTADGTLTCLKATFHSTLECKSIVNFTSGYSGTAYTFGASGSECIFGVWASSITFCSNTASNSVYGAYTFGYSSTKYCNFHVYGNITYSGYCSQSSDERVKKDWIALDKYDQFFDLLQPKGYRYIYEASDKYHLGFGAQTVQSALEECGLSEDDFAGLTSHTISKDSEDYRGYTTEYGLAYTEFIALLVDQVQKLKTRVSSLENKILALES